MKNLLILIFSICLFSAVDAQIFNDDFESYTAGDLLGASSSTWTTWSGGTADDVEITDTRANSGTNSIHFVGSGAGGPADVVLPFGGKRVSGQFTMSMAMYVEPGKSAYLNFQGETTPGSVWTMNANFTALGAFQIDDVSFVQIRSDYPIGEWFDFEVEVNITSNIWDFKINGECVGSYAATDNFLASLDLFPLGDSDFYVDDMYTKYSAIPGPAPTFDAGLAGVGFGSAGLDGTSANVTATVINKGTTEINSFDISYTDGTVMESQSFSGMTMAAGATMELVMDVPYSFSVDNKKGQVRLSNVNGMAADDHACNDVLNSFFTVVVPRPGKRVLVEEGTGTWCGWCPRGDVFMRAMADKYPDHFVPVAVHNGDIMTLAEHNSGLGITGFPGAKVMRNSTAVDPSAIEEPILDALSVAPYATMETGARFDEDTRELEVSVTVLFPTGSIFPYRMGVIVTEDEVRGTSSDYDQANYYSGGSVIMGGYETLADPVPAIDMVYEFVSRALLGGYSGIPVQDFDVGDGDTKTFYFTYTVPAEFNTEHFNLIPVLIAPVGVIDNAGHSTLEEAIERGFVVSNTQDPVISTNTHVYPNPFSNNTNIELNLETPANVQITVLNAMGQKVASRNYGTQSGKNVFPFDGTNLANGVYYMNIYVDDKFTTKRISIMH